MNSNNQAYGIKLSNCNFCCFTSDFDHLWAEILQNVSCIEIEFLAIIIHNTMSSFHSFVFRKVKLRSRKGIKPYPFLVSALQNFFKGAWMKGWSCATIWQNLIPLHEQFCFLQKIQLSTEARYCLFCMSNVGTPKRRRAEKLWRRHFGATFSLSVNCKVCGSFFLSLHSNFVINVKRYDTLFSRVHSVLYVRLSTL